MANGDASGERLRKQMAVQRIETLTAQLNGNYYHGRDIHDAIARASMLVKSIACST